MVQYLHFRILEFPLNSWGWTMAMAFGFYHGLPTWCCWFHWRTDRMAVLEVTLLLRKFCLKRPTEEVQNRINQKKTGTDPKPGIQWDFSMGFQPTNMEIQWDSQHQTWDSKGSDFVPEQSIKGIFKISMRHLRIYSHKHKSNFHALLKASTLLWVCLKMG